MVHALIQRGARIAGKYRIVRPLGEGGMGMVYMAEHELLDRTVAIKVLHAQLQHRELAVKRFEREIKAMALVQNPHIAQAVDAGVLENGALYLAMEYLDGHNLRAELKLRRAIPYPEAVAYVMQACAGVAAVHDLSIIHRDLKPHNLFLTQLTEARCVKVLDFGIAKFIDRPDGGMTDSEVAVGTPLYMAPEQLSRPEDISRRTDVWSLAVVLYELIAGVSPFAASTPGGVVAAVVLQDPVPLSSIVPEVPLGLTRAIAKALSKSPAQRTSGVRELAAELAPFAMPLDRIVVTAPTTSTRPLPALERVSLHPELAACIEKEVDAFEPNNSSSGSGAPAHVVRELPSLAKLAITPPDAELLVEPPYARETVEQPVVVPARDSSWTTRASSQPTALLQIGKPDSEPARAEVRNQTRSRLLVAGGLLIVCAAVGMTLVSWSRSAAPPLKPAPALQEGEAASSARLALNDAELSTTPPPSPAPPSSESTGAVPAAPASPSTSPTRTTKATRRAPARPKPASPAPAQSSPPLSQPLHL